MADNEAENFAPDEDFAEVDISESLQEDDAATEEEYDTEDEAPAEVRPASDPSRHSNRGEASTAPALDVQSAVPWMPGGRARLCLGSPAGPQRAGAGPHSA